MDLLMSMALLSILSWLTFSVFAQTSSIFNLSSSRANLQSEIRRIQVSMGRAVSQSSFYTISTHTPPAIPVPRVDNLTMMARRDSMSCATLNDPSNPASFDDTSGLPKWDRYLVYMASQESPNGKLIQFQINRPGPDDLQVEMSPALPGVVAVYPAGVLAGTAKVITHRLVHFETALSAADQTVTISLIVRGDAGRIVGGRKTTAELLETKLIFRPENTWPRL